MSMTKFQKGLATLLMRQGLGLDKASMIVSILSQNEKLTCMMLVWVYDTNPTEEQIMRWMVEHT